MEKKLIKKTNIINDIDAGKLSQSHNVSANGRCELCSDKCMQFSIKFDACYTRLLTELELTNLSKNKN